VLLRVRVTDTGTDASGSKTASHSRYCFYIARWDVDKIFTVEGGEGLSQHDQQSWKGRQRRCGFGPQL